MYHWYFVEISLSANNVTSLFRESLVTQAIKQKFLRNKQTGREEQVHCKAASRYAFWVRTESWRAQGGGGGQP